MFTLQLIQSAPPESCLLITKIKPRFPLAMRGGAERSREDTGRKGSKGRKGRRPDARPRLSHRHGLLEEEVGPLVPTAESSGADAVNAHRKLGSLTFKIKLSTSVLCLQSKTIPPLVS